jgi:glycosyltransferase involved in cell wall biosynthesis
MSGILVFFHCPSNTGYAIGRHEYTFSQMARRLAEGYDKVHFAYPVFHDGPSKGLPEELVNFVKFDPTSSDSRECVRIREYVRENQIRVAFGFDQPLRQPGYGCLRAGGVQYIISYWGAPVSGINTGLKLMAKKLLFRLSRNGPDHYIFQSEGMRETATHGLGVPLSRTSVVRSGVDTETFKPSLNLSCYAHEVLGIDRGRKIVFYSGHMDARKGVHVIVKAASHIVNVLGRRDLHFLILGNKNGKERVFDDLYKGTAAEAYITFGGYRDDVAALQSSADIAVIAATGWDSHTMTAVEVAASGLPLIVSDLPGLREAVTEETGMRVPPGDYTALADSILSLADNDALRAEMGAAARERVLIGYTREHQIKGLESVVRRVTGDLFPAGSELQGDCNAWG